MMTNVTKFLLATAFITTGCSLDEPPVEPVAPGTEMQAAALTAKASGYAIVDLGIGLSAQSLAYGTNDRDQVVGVVWDEATSVQEAVLWEDGTMRTLGTGWGNQSYAYSINNQGQAVGGFGTAEHYRACLWQNGIMTELSAGPNVECAAYGINNRGQVVGSLWWYSEGDVATFHACLWENGIVTDLGAMGAGSSGMSINDAGQVTGTVDILDGEDYIQHAFLWNMGSMTDLGGAGSYSSGCGINNRGSVVGMVGLLTGDFYSGFLWERGDMRIVSQRADAFCINELNQVGGDAWTDEIPTHAVLWDKEGQIDLGGLGGSSSGAYGMNNHGDLVGYSMTEGDASMHAVLWSRHAGGGVAKTSPASAPVVKTTVRESRMPVPISPAFRGPAGRRAPVGPWFRSPHTLR